MFRVISLVLIVAGLLLLVFPEKILMKDGDNYYTDMFNEYHKYIGVVLLLGGGYYYYSNMEDNKMDMVSSDLPTYDEAMSGSD